VTLSWLAVRITVIGVLIAEEDARKGQGKYHFSSDQATMPNCFVTTCISIIEFAWYKHIDLAPALKSYNFYWIILVNLKVEMSRIGIINRHVMLHAKVKKCSVYFL